jgi:hypothetical protein
MPPQRIVLCTLKLRFHDQTENVKITGIVNISRYFHIIQDKVFNELTFISFKYNQHERKVKYKEYKLELSFR